ncbi:MAG: serine/threonine-protein phosphatase [Prevotella sp.]|nr:serine/threonine-protein phosphatase [Prevotella sp.]
MKQSSMKNMFDALTHRGMVRDNNEDCWMAQTIWNDSFLLCGVIDGMGGYEGGEVAAEIARTTIIDEVVTHEAADNILMVLEAAVVKANNAIVEHKMKHADVGHMGCVATVGILDLNENQLFLAHVGDTRLYQFHQNVLQKLTFDHSIVGQKEDSGVLTEEEAMSDPERNIVTKSLGFERLAVHDADYLDLGVFPLQPGTQLLFCSDGLYDMVTSREISSVLQQETGVHEKSRQLIDLANECGGKDNVTVVLVQLFQSDSSNEGDATTVPTEGAERTSKELDTAREDAEEKHCSPKVGEEAEANVNGDEKKNDDDVLPQARKGWRHVKTGRGLLALVAIVAFALGVLVGYLLKVFVF